MPKFAEGDTIAMRGEVARINEDGTVTKPRSDKLRNRAGLMRARP
jgi:hypothetical protein